MVDRRWVGKRRARASTVRVYMNRVALSPNLCIHNQNCWKGTVSPGGLCCAMCAGDSSDDEGDKHERASTETLHLTSRRHDRDDYDDSDEDDDDEDEDDDVDAGDDEEEEEEDDDDARSNGGRLSLATSAEQQAELKRRIEARKRSIVDLLNNHNEWTDVQIEFFAKRLLAECEGATARLSARARSARSAFGVPVAIPASTHHDPPRTPPRVLQYPKRPKGIPPAYARASRTGDR